MALDYESRTRRGPENSNALILLRGKIDLFSLDAPVKMATAAGMRIKLQILGAA